MRPHLLRRHLAGLTLALLVLAHGAVPGAQAQAPTAGEQTSTAQARTSPTPTDQTRTLSRYPRFGDRSRAVWSLQKKLVKAGLLRAHLRTGTFGPRTRDALRRLQRRYDLPESGRVNARTLRALDRAVKAMTGPRTWYHKLVIGTSTQGRNINAYRAGEPGKPVVMVVATMHGEEDFGQYVVRGLMEGRPIKGVDLWLLPVLNPDGYAKDRRYVDGNVDLNRNFPHRFIVRAHSGPRAKSAKETRVIMRFLRRVEPTYLVSWHQPLIGVDTYRVKDRGLMRRLSRGLDIAPRYLDCRGSCHGTMTGWYNANHHGAAITVEYAAVARSMKRMKGTDANAVLRAIGGRRG
jgi:protein MpaA